MPQSPILEAFSLTHAQILDGETAFDAAESAIDNDVYGVDQASLDPSMDEYDNTGDDAVLSSWFWLNHAEVNVRAGYLSFPLIAAMTGETLTSTESGEPGVVTGHSIDLWSTSSFNVAPKPMLVRMPSKDKDGQVASLVIGLFRVQFKPITFEGPTYKDGLKVNYVGRALLSATDEVGVEFAGTDVRKIGRLIASTPA